MKFIHFLAMLARLSLFIALTFVYFRQVKPEPFLGPDDPLGPNGLDYILKRNSGNGAGVNPGGGSQIMEAQDRGSRGSEFDSKERRASSTAGMGANFIRFGRAGPKGSDVVIRYGRDGVNRLSATKTSRLHRLARLALVCSNFAEEFGGASNLALMPVDQLATEDRILRDICFGNVQLHPTMPEYVWDEVEVFF